MEDRMKDLECRAVVGSSGAEIAAVTRPESDAMTASKRVKQIAHRGSLRQEVLGAIGCGIFMAMTVGLVWLLAGVSTALVAFFAALGLTFLYMDVGSLPSDPEEPDFSS